MNDLDILVKRIDEKIAAEVKRQKAAWAEAAQAS
jgi:hypothetical protein